MLSLPRRESVIWVYPGRHDIFFHPSQTHPYQPDPNLVERYTFNAGKNAHVFCKTCGCQVFEAREAKEGEVGFEGWEEQNGSGRSFGVNVAMLNGMEEFLADGVGEKLSGLTRNRDKRWEEPIYEVRL